MLKKTIAIDIDDVLADTTRCLIDHYSQLKGTLFPYGDITSYDYWNQLGVVDDSEAIEIVHGYEKAGYPGLKPTHNTIKEILSRLAERFNLIIVSARPSSVTKVTEEWVQKHCGNIFKTIILTGNPYTSTTYRTKAEICIEYGANYLLDDQIKHLQQANTIGITPLLFGSYDWNNYSFRNDTIKHLKDWQEVEQYFANE